MDYKPVKLNNENEVQQLIADKNAEYVDLFPEQLNELFIIRFFSTLEDKQNPERHPEYQNFCETKKNEYTILYYPWLNKIFKLVGADDFFTLKTNRNQDLINAKEQKILKDYTVLVLGLSVGSNIAFLLTQGGFSNKIFLADLDTLDTTNLNRIFVGINEIKINKSIIAARKIYEGNPYAEVIPIPEGINNDNLELLLKNEKIDCIVEEVDSLPIKISTRKLASKYNVPILMITDNGFRVVLHVERYDLGYDKIFEKEISFWEDVLSKELSIQTVSQIIADVIIGDMNKVDPKLIESTMKVFQKQLVAWPQLGSTAMLGGVIASQMIKKMALKEIKDLFIKKFIDLEL